MNKLLFCALFLLAGAALAQQPAPVTPPAPQDSMEPGVNTSAPASTPVAEKPAAKSTAGGAANNPSAKPGVAKPQAANKSNAKDRLDLDSTQITGNRELPKVLYIVPWRSAELGDLVGRPVNSLLDEVLELSLIHI